MKKKQLTEEQKETIFCTMDSQGFWYALCEGYLNPGDILENQEDIDKVNDAIATIQTFERDCPQF